MFFSMLHSSVKRSVRCADIRRTPEVDSRMHPIQERKFSIHTAHDVRWQIIENKTQSSLEINVSIIIGSRDLSSFTPAAGVSSLVSHTYTVRGSVSHSHKTL